jgi:leucyl/phenylalanyl-tRNA---protein transferase
MIFTGWKSLSQNAPDIFMQDLTPEIILAAYTQGIFPMSEDRNDPDLFWVDPQHRGIFPLDRFHISKSLKKVIKRQLFEVTFDTDFTSVMKACAATKLNRKTTWINDIILKQYAALHDMGHAHSVECWQDGKLVGGLYGVSFASVFCGESMFSLEKNASKVALVYLVARLIAGGFTLLDTQFLTDHLASLGAIEVSRDDYHRLLKKGLESSGDFQLLDSSLTGSEILQSITQTS